MHYDVSYPALEHCSQIEKGVSESCPGYLVELSGAVKPHFAAENHGIQSLGALGYTAANRC